jgi:hypothetical protein
MTIDLSECRTKIERAHKLRDALEAVIPSEEKATEPRFPVSAKFESASSYYVLWVADIPEDFYRRVGSIIGDAVHELRSALDCLFRQLANHYIGGTNPAERAEGIEFPIESTSLGFTEKKMEVPEIPSGTWAIIEGAQPYNGGNPLNLLRILSDDYKNGVLEPILISAKSFDLTEGFRSAQEFGWRQDIESDNTHAETHLNVGAEVTRIKITPLSPFAPVEVEVAAYITPYVQLPKGDRPAVLGLTEMISEVEKVVDDVMVHFK